MVAAALTLGLVLAGCSNDSVDESQSGTSDAQPGTNAVMPTAGSQDAPPGATVVVPTAGSEAATGEPNVSTSSAAPEEESSDPTSASEQSSPGASTGEASGPTDISKVDLANQKFDLSWQDALDRAGEHFDGDVTKIELEIENHRYSYKIELMSDTQEFEYEIDANTGDVLDQETDDLDKNEVKTERQNKKIDLDKVIGVEEAMKTALAAQDGRVKEWKIEGKSTGPRYEFDIVKPGSTDDVEVQVDAISGKILRTGS